MLAVSVLLLLSIAALLVRAIVGPLAKARALAQAIQGGNLNNSTVVSGNDEFTDTLHALDDMDKRLASIVCDVRHISQQVSSSAADISQGNDDLSQRTQEQAQGAVGLPPSPVGKGWATAVRAVSSSMLLPRWDSARTIDTRQAPPADAIPIERTRSGTASQAHSFRPVEDRAHRSPRRKSGTTRRCRTLYRRISWTK